MWFISDSIDDCKGELAGIRLRSMYRTDCSASEYMVEASDGVLKYKDTLTKYKKSDVRTFYEG